RTTASDEGGWLGSRSLFGALVLPESKHVDRGQLTLFHERTPGRFPFTSTSMTRSGRRESNASDLSRATAAVDGKAGGWALRARGLTGKSVGESPGSLTSPFSSTFDSTVSLVSLEGRRNSESGDFLSLRVSDSRIWGLYDRDTASQSTSAGSRSALSVDTRTSIESFGLRTFGDFVTQTIAASYLGSSTFHQFDADLGQSWEIPLSSSFMLQPAYRYRSSTGTWVKALALLNDEGRTRRYLTYSEGFRTPSLSDRFGSYGTFRGNPGLNSERSWSAEAGFNTESGERFGSYLEGWALGAATYFTRYDDLVDSQTTAGIQSKINAGRARAIGFEANAATTVSVWMLWFGYNYLDARNESVNEPLRLSPHHQLSVSAAQQLGPVVIEVRDTYWSEFHDRDPLTSTLVSLPSWNTIDLELRTLGLTDWEMKAGVLNVFDRPRELTIGYPEPQRRIFVSALRFF
ncbi:MAG: TonB-dependent receptor, partial [Bdellovibrionota bacterium]